MWKPRNRCALGWLQDRIKADIGLTAKVAGQVGHARGELGRARKPTSCVDSLNLQSVFTDAIVRDDDGSRTEMSANTETEAKA